MYYFYVPHHYDFYGKMGIINGKIWELLRGKPN